jgi:hypothetical protein
VAAPGMPRACRGGDRRCANARQLLLAGSDPPSAIKGEQHVAHRVGWSEPVDLWPRQAPGARSAPRSTTCSWPPWRRPRSSPAHAGRRRGGARARPGQSTPARSAADARARELSRAGSARAARGDRGSRRAGGRRQAPDGRHQARPRGGDCLAILSPIGRTPAPVEARPIDLLSSKGSLVLTNMPGPRAARSRWPTRRFGACWSGRRAPPASR